MADYQFGLPENDPNYRPAEKKELEEEQEQQDKLNRLSPPEPKLFSDAAPLSTPESNPQENLTLIKNQSAIKKGAAQFPVAPPPDELIEATAPDVTPGAPAPVFTDALPPTAGKLPFFEPEAPRKTRKVRSSEAFDEDKDIKPTRRATTRPRRSMSNQFNQEKAADKAKQTIGDAIPIAHYYLAQVQRVLFTPSDFFAEMEEEEGDLTEAAIFMGITLGVCAVMQLLCGNFWALVHLIGHIFVVVAASFFGTYILKHFEPDRQFDFKTIFAIFAYAQAPKLIAWINMGILPIGYLIATAYSLALSTIAFQKIFGLSKMKSALIISGVFVAARAIAWFLHLL
jgi:hypothetical protein